MEDALETAPSGGLADGATAKQQEQGKEEQETGKRKRKRRKKYNKGRKRRNKDNDD